MLSLGALRSLGFSLTRRTVALSLADLQDGYLLSLQSAGRTLAHRLWASSRIGRLIAATGNVKADELQPEHIRRALIRVKAGMRGREVTDGYVESHRKAWAAMFSWALRQEPKLLGRSPMATVAKVKADRREIVFPTLEEVQRLLASQPATTAEGIRNRAIIVLLYDTGMRIGELVRIGLQDVDLEHGEIRHIFGKDRTERTVPIIARTRMLIWSYVQRARPRTLFATSDRLFLSRRVAPLTPSSVNQWLRRAGRSAGIDPRKAHPHAFRHAFITEAGRAGMNESTIMAITGIKTPSVLRRYMHLMYADVRKPHESASPAARLAAI